ncbi:MAG: alpha-amylase family glycosyl hydrolase [Clostridia bacterium]
MPDAGTFENLKELHEKANANGIKIIIDVAFNHCNSDNRIFQEAIRNPSSKYRNWFFIDNNGNYQYWYNEFKDMPVFNQRNYEFQQYVYGENGVIAKYAPYVDGLD